VAKVGLRPASIGMLSVGGQQGELAVLDVEDFELHGLTADEA
jgi:hypothetical protein